MAINLILSSETIRKRKSILGIEWAALSSVIISPRFLRSIHESLQSKRSLHLLTHILLSLRKYCENANLCKNDGSEFKLANGKFVNAKNRRDLDAGFAPETSDGPKSPFRKFMGEDGVERLWLSSDRIETIVGKEVWSDETTSTKISHEIFDD